MAQNGLTWMVQVWENNLPKTRAYKMPYVA